MAWKWLRVKEETQRQLFAIGHKGETYDEIITRLLTTRSSA
jgi:hypothetical protein